ncbi:MAG TPA: ribonuclease HII, partial [Candidatus Paceibacterota bacterium]|nr:ribonuclease HII [Candidatus Paceibacterota bacterium]
YNTAYLMKFIVGIDEVGRGPIAGPVTIGMCIAPIDFDFSHFAKIKDSKKLSEKKRNEWSTKIHELKNKGMLSFAIASISAAEIDAKGISPCLKEAIKRGLADIGANPAEVEIRLDGALRAPSVFLNQKTIIRGDEKEPIISAASIVAKVHRDKLMTDFAKTYPLYGFEKHKGYGTSEHFKAIRLYGISPIHRKTFLTKMH